MSDQKAKADLFRELHDDKKLLVLPNVWDAAGARMLEHLKYPAVATASAAIAFSLGYDDGQRVTFETMLDVIRRVAAAVDVPVTADVEQGYADAPDALAANMRRVIDAGAVGVNIEDSIVEGSELRTIEAQCERLRAVRAMAAESGVPLLINARVDVFLSNPDKAAAIEEVIERGRAYLDAGADCIYPIGPGDLETIKLIVEALKAPVNVYAGHGASPMDELEAAGVARLSLGSALFRTSMTAMRDVALELREQRSYTRFTEDVMQSSEVQAFLDEGSM